MFLKIIENSWYTSECIKHPLLRPGSHMIQHVDEVAVKESERSTSAESKLHPVLHTGERGAGVAGIEGGVV